MSSIFNLFGYNNSVLSGAMDMIVIKQEDNSFKSTPLMVRFGQFRILKAKETNVEIYINDTKIDLPMRLSEQGEAYVLKERKTGKDKLNIAIDASISDDFGYAPAADKGLSSSLSPRSTNNNNFEEDIGDNNNQTNITVMKDTATTSNNKATHAKRRENANRTNNNTSSVHKRKMSFDLFLYSGTTRSKVIKNKKLIISKETSFQIDASPNATNNGFSLSNDIKIELSNSWSTISKNKDDSKFDIQRIFTESQYTKEDFFKDPWKVINNTNLAIKHGKHIYTWKVIAPLLISYLAYGESLPERTLNSLTTQQNGFLMWKTIENNAYKIELTTKNIIDNSSSTSNGASNSTTSGTGVPSSKSKLSQNTKKRKYKKSYYFTSEHLSQMNLNYGKNTVQFKIKTTYYGSHVLVADMYLWNYNDKIIISDYDGTITRTDVIGMFFGWTHKKVALLYNNLDRNGYKIIYLTARPVCTHERTKNTLFSLTQDSLKMPKGPVLKDAILRGSLP